MKAAALRGALSDRARNGRVHVLTSLVEGDSPSTKAAIAALDALGDRRNLLVVLERDDVVLEEPAQPATGCTCSAVDQLNTYDVLVADDVVFTSGSLDAFLAGPAEGKSATAVATESEAATVEAPVARRRARGREAEEGRARRRGRRGCRRRAPAEKPAKKAAAKKAPAKKSAAPSQAADADSSEDDK